MDVRHQVARLYARAAFGATTTQIDSAAANGYAAAVDSLLAFPDPAGQPADVEMDGLVEAGLVADQPGYSSYPVDISTFQGWWIQRMASTAYPLQEKLTLYWHGHFATAYSKVYSYRQMLNQNRTLRANAGGSFRALAKAMTWDPAMLIFLDGQLSTLNGPNENYAREFFELFSLGHDNGYTQADIHESARALTGYALDNGGNGHYYPTFHDATPKTILGNTGAWVPLDVIDITLDRHPQGHVAAAWVARRMADFFHHPDPEPDLVATMASALVGAGYAIKPMLRVLFLHPAFTGGATLTHRAPAELVATTVRALGLGSALQTAQTADAYAAQVPTYGQYFDPFGLAAQRMGQSLFNPVNVAGWKGGAAWANTATVIARYNWAAQAAQMVTGDIVSQVLADAHRDPAQSAGPWMVKLGLLDLRADTQAAIAQWVAAAKTAGDDAPTVARGVLTLLLASPDFALR